MSIDSGQQGQTDPHRRYLFVELDQFGRRVFGTSFRFESVSMYDDLTFFFSLNRPARLSIARRAPRVVAQTHPLRR